MFGGDDEDGDFLSPADGAKLASLFGPDEETSPRNESFYYTAPKQPRKSSNPVSVIQTAALSPGTLEVLFAAAVQAFQYINGQYVKQGKLGAAILGNHTSKEYKLLLYVSQQKQITSAKIHVDFIFTVQPNNYCTFYDDQRQTWSLMFESAKSSFDFCKEVCLAKVNSCNVLDVVLTQDLSLGEGHAVQYGDSLEVAYRGWLLQNHTIGQMFDSNQNKDKLLRLKIGAGKVIQGWEKGVLGMKKAGCRLIVVPPSLACSQGVPDCVPANSTLIFEAAIRRVKVSKDCGSDQTSASSRDSGTLSPTLSVDNLILEPPVQTAALDSGKLGETPLRAKSDSLSEQLTTTDATKAKLISRMAKMGQPMLPFLTCQPESSDSELEDTTVRAKNLPVASSPVQISSAAPVQAHALPHPYPVFPTNVLPNLTNVATQPGLLGSTHTFQFYSNTQTSVPTNQLQSLSQIYPSRVPYIGSSDVTSFLMIETRQQNTEIRLAVGKVAEKVDQLVSKIDDLQRQGTVSLGLSGISMESSMIIQNVQRIIQENECLKKELFEKGSRIEEQNPKISEVFNQSQRYMDNSNTHLEKRNDSLKSSGEQKQVKLLQAEQDKIQLKEKLASATANLSQMQLEGLTHQQKISELQTKLSTSRLDCERHSKHISDLESQLEELREISERSQSQYREEMQRRKELELKLKNMEGEVNDLKTNQEGLKQGSHSATVKEVLERRVAELEMKLTEQESLADTATEVKRVMNGVFHSLRGEFDLSESYSGHTVLAVLIKTIKNVTLQLLHDKDSPTTIKTEELADQEEDTVKPPPPPNEVLLSQAKEKSVTGKLPMENGEIIFQVRANDKSTSHPVLEEEEVSLKGCPPPAPLFGDNNDDDDPDWLS
ncbi:FK506-binding protein 15 isoform X4 [Syngnathus typhle]|uniref:FK506-binding protein 15 isoform X4 n=1 Tax=Syngnathus typhle TaxID=161592 RepID=UPI002A6AF2C5|nr:FK506-binding protein 15 isoform X4 [Syngnathus typhle]